MQLLLAISHEDVLSVVTYTTELLEDTGSGLGVDRF